MKHRYLIMLMNWSENAGANGLFSLACACSITMIACLWTHSILTSCDLRLVGISMYDHNMASSLRSLEWAGLV